MTDGCFVDHQFPRSHQDHPQLTEDDPDETEEIDDPQNRFRTSVNQTCWESFVPDYPVKVNQNEANNTEMISVIYQLW